MVKKYDLEDRLVAFSGETIIFSRKLSAGYSSEVLSKQLIRSSTSSVLNFGEAQGSESNKDFIHKNKIVLKELKECRANFKLLNYLQLGDMSKLRELTNEVEQLIAIIATIIKNTP